MKRLAVITGANRGLGFATARGLGSAGVKVLVGAREVGKGQDAVARLQREDIDAEPLAIDVDAPATVAAAARAVCDRHGRVDILVNNAGILPEATASDAERPLDLRMFRRTFETNLFGAVAVTQAFLPL